ncbi:MAG: hypothetical protein L6R39_006740 [Caloplaca ligustica]|nr:MAG: hypothetical protein L6R39_006740 [Caloplaca ligustica]
MALHRAFSFPLSSTEECSTIRPFAVNRKDVSRLRSCEAFQIIRGLLVDQENPTFFCDQHGNDCREDKDAWLLQRDITYALILPVLEIHRYASRIATALLGNRHIFDLELVFRGEARGTFSWLQCFVKEEEDWCLARGCPGCVVSYMLQAEPTIRIILVACRLSSSLRQHQRNTNNHNNIQNTTPHPPLFDFWSSVMKAALDDDPFWGPALWKDFEARATALETGIEELVKQCIDLAPLAASAAVQQHLNNDSPPTSPTYPSSAFRKPLQSASQEQQQRQWLPSMVYGCWTTLLADAAAAANNNAERAAGMSPRAGGGGGAGGSSHPVLSRSSTA